MAGLCGIGGNKKASAVGLLFYVGLGEDFNAFVLHEG